ncbi:bisphosphoglycerate mutase isoform X1 [Chelonia mydas]|uniref:bisphosphoglycerate mutase isoform X1 n=1 Tax=Chelonia mydas TaxID=8469 RepID=UPI001CA8C882|nr:bisphosphoglycerate mutase isoform X1 [Chelonia mydas]XP_043395607.1 bisphosphoglycerate mutase isoform X1 [Chelonia mydas]XP_043395610.1 bisphosphoglycerate mutase isoform X1 [Chelonia mydas]XP_043395612.1 bisphosphoglycerate mutase isoform X1 [Chelonia mydas]
MTKYKLVLLRHGEGAWNKENRFCSWVDQKLSSNGIKEARNCGKHLKALGFQFDQVFTSILSRSIQTAWLVLEEMGQEWVPTQSSWRLNERHYGALIGLNRAEMALNHGEEQVKIWRRSYDVTPPPITESHPYYKEIYDDRRYKCCDVSQDKLPMAESLKEVLERLLPYWNEKIAPELKSGKVILISAHGNSTRALLKHLEAPKFPKDVSLQCPVPLPGHSQKGIVFAASKEGPSACQRPLSLFPEAGRLPGEIASPVVIVHWEISPTLASFNSFAYLLCKCTSIVSGLTLLSFHWGCRQNTISLSGADFCTVC